VRLVFVFVALALAPALLTLVLLWRELAPRSRLATSQGIQRSMHSGLELARGALAARQAAAESLAASAVHAAEHGLGLAALAGCGCVAVVFEPTTRTVLEAQGSWAARAAEFLERPALPWPTATAPLDLLPAPDSSYVVAATRALGTRQVLVALPVPAAEAAAILRVVEGAQQAQRLGFLEELKLATAARLLGVVAAVFGLLAVLLGIGIARTLTQPLDRLRQAFEAVAGGNLGHQVDVRGAGDGELGRLLQGFNAMSRELDESKRQVVRATRLAAWQGVARRLAHEIKNPLTPITLSIHRLRKRTPADDSVVRECLDTILEETSHLERLANEFSSFARLPKPNLEPTEPGPVLQQVADLYAAHPGVRIHADTRAMPAVLADRDQVRQVFTNLLKNAVEAMPQGGTVDLRWEQEDGRLYVTVLDSGSGFAPQALEHLFDPTFTTKPSGSGLGLAIVRRIVEDHGGTIEAGNRPEGGAWVRFGLRCAS
jgi:nitrogen fixation/metabolism regulation signal transduction histidine kinase